MESIPEDLAGLTAVQLCQKVGSFLDRHAWNGNYDPRIDWEYRRSRQALLDRLHEEPFVTPHATAATALFPSTLERLDKFDHPMRTAGAPRLGKSWRYASPDAFTMFTDHNRRRWWLHPEGGQAKLAALQSRLLTVMERAGLPAFNDAPIAPPARPSPDRQVATPKTAIPTPAARARARARELREAGATIKEIARDVKRSERMVHHYLK